MRLLYQYEDAKIIEREFLPGPNKAPIRLLECDCKAFKMPKKPSDTPFCQHLKKLYTLSHDVAHDKRLLPGCYEVVVFTNPALAVPVTVAIPSPFVIEQSLTIAYVETKKLRLVQLGFVFAGCGRKWLRTLFLEWVVGCAFDLPFCEAAQHYQSLPWGNDRTKFDPRSPTHLANAASLLLKFKCLTCLEDEGVPDV